MYAKFHHNIPSVQEIGPFSLFQNLELGKASTDEKCHFAISWARSCYQSIPLSSRDGAIFTFSEFEPRQRLGQSKMTFDNLLGYILSISMDMQNFIKIFQTVKSYRHFSRTGRRQNLHKLSGDKIKCLIIGHSMKFNFKFQLTFLESCNLLFLVVK